MNARWHRQHPMPARPTLAQRIAWHREHARRCACRPVPRTLLEYLRVDGVRAGKTSSSRRKTLL
jgi:hypothetical protein